eukprot:CAMPEP_0184487952 /NCGR_PEP_ID=MMETSP0113_2-20130426/10434_1 /TAXON_ID=91329 /ORGANISM="Norrisiella sphaerica, Strain BC52" /LENGTH=1462 /DNA_ID=CAMNT_0026870393 /DNA_START=41 /DNA_END=4429 /DNA_ORIENTATION=+
MHTSYMSTAGANMRGLQKLPSLRRRSSSTFARRSASLALLLGTVVALVCVGISSHMGLGMAPATTTARNPVSRIGTITHRAPLPVFRPSLFSRSTVSVPRAFQPATPTETDVKVPSAGGMFTQTKPEERKVIPRDEKGRKKFKVVYVVLESQYQSSMTQACKNINRDQENVCVECSGYLLEELRDPANYEAFKKDVADANVFIGSLIFVQDLAEKVVEAVKPARDNLDAVLCFPSMPDVMKLNKLGQFTLSSLGVGNEKKENEEPKAKKSSVVKDFFKAASKASPATFEENLLKLLRTLPTVLKFLPAGIAQDGRSFLLSLQYWLGGSDDNLENFLLMIANKYVDGVKGQNFIDEKKIAPPNLIAEKGIWHPLAPKVFESSDEYLEWYNKEVGPLNGVPADAPTVGVILQKSHINTKDEAHYVSLFQELEARGCRPVPVYTGSLDFSIPVEQYFYNRQKRCIVDSVINLTGFAMVGGPATQDHDRAVSVLKNLNRPYIVSVPLVFQSFEEWEKSQLGLHPVQTALQVSLPELDGAIEPIIFAGRDAVTGRSVPMQDRIDILAERAMNWAKLRKIENKDKKLAITIFSFPPDKGNVGTAAYLNVFGSIHAVMKQLKAEGYDVDVPENVEDLIDGVLKDKEAELASPELNVEYRMSVDEYLKKTPYADDLRDNWGAPPGNLNSDGENLLVYGKRFGNVFIGVQPSFGYEGDPMRLLFAKSASPHHGFAAYYTYIEKIFGANAVLHFGTHGSLEFMPGKQVGMSGKCYPDRLIHSLPNLYYYAANNPSEATIAKRRGYASTISYLTPPAENAGLYKGLKELGELVGSYQGLRETGRGASIVNSIVASARQCNLDKDIADLPTEEDDAQNMDLEHRDRVVGKVYNQLMEIESRLLPCGLHTVGVPPTVEEAVATLVNIASLDRPEDGFKALPRLCAEAVGRDIEEIYRNSDNGVLEDVTLRQNIVEATRAAVKAAAMQSANAEGRIESVNSMEVQLKNLVGIKSPWRDALLKNGFDVSEDKLTPLFKYLGFCLEQVVADNELGGLMDALDGKYIAPGPGGDPIRNPKVLPTGKNMHALDPQSIPTRAAVDCAKVVVDRLLDRQRQDMGGEWPESVALTLWGTDNIKTYGESLAQVMWLVGVEPVADSIGRVNKLRLIPLEELGRPRVDVVVTCSGVFRDLFINQMNLLDKAVKMAAEADEPLEMNFVRKHALEQAEELGVDLRSAATRIFSNSAGSYSANVGIAIENGGWKDESQLQEQFLERKSFAFNADRPGELAKADQVFKSSLKKVDVTFQNLDSSEISLSDVSHYFDSDPTKVVQGLRKDGKKPTAFVADTTTANAQVRTLSETVRLDARTKLLNPKFYEGMLNQGYEGAREITKRLRNTMGWSATAGAVDNFVYEDANKVFIEDPAMQQRLMETNPNAFRDMIQTFLEANGRGYWDTDEENIERLRNLYQDCEDKLEGIE